MSVLHSLAEERMTSMDEGSYIVGQWASGDNDDDE